MRRRGGSVTAVVVLRESEKEVSKWRGGGRKMRLRERVRRKGGEGGRFHYCRLGPGSDVGEVVGCEGCGHGRLGMCRVGRRGAGMAEGVSRSELGEEKMALTGASVGSYGRRRGGEECVREDE